MKKIISLALAAVMLSSVAAVPTMAATNPLIEKAVSFDSATWTAREVPEGTVVTLKPDYDADLNVERATIKNGGFEVQKSWSDSLKTGMFWMDGINAEGVAEGDWKPWTFVTDQKIEGKYSVCADLSPAMAALGNDRVPHMAFQGIFVEPCSEDQVYRLSFYVKADRELGLENPQMMIYFIHTKEDGSVGDAFNTTIGTTNVMIDASNIDYHWYDQTKVAFEDGQNPTGEIKQGYGPFAQGKWVQIDAYFQTPVDFVEGAYGLQLQTNTSADCKLYFDAFSLEKIYMDQVDLGIPLKSASDDSNASVKFTKKNIKIKKGKKVVLRVKLTGAKKATFSVNKKGKKVVKLSKKKAKSVVVTGKKKGKATITAKAAGKKATCKVTVR